MTLAFLKNLVTLKHLNYLEPWKWSRMTLLDGTIFWLFIGVLGGAVAWVFRG